LARRIRARELKPKPPKPHKPPSSISRVSRLFLCLPPLAEIIGNVIQRTISGYPGEGWFTTLETLVAGSKYANHAYVAESAI
jgi:hypothetical protein